jgi:hypothetical protein
MYSLCRTVSVQVWCLITGQPATRWIAVSFSLSLRLTLHTGSRFKGDAVMAYVGDPSHKSVLRRIYRLSCH